jgi:ribonuclease BN (tRNA processing enzyme)
MHRIDRRGFLAGAAGVCAAAFSPQAPSARRPATRLIFLGTAGGPRPKKNASAPAQVILVNEVPYVVDCGNGVARQLVLAGVPVTTLRHVFITHHHSDHNADYGNLVWLAWGAGLKSRVDTWGPPPLEAMTRLFFEMNAYDIQTRITDEGRVPLAPLVHVHEITGGGLVMQDEQVKVTAALVTHPAVAPAFGFRFDTADRSIVISGDTARSDNLARLARGADILVHEALYVPAIDRVLGTDTANAPSLRKHLIDSHTAVEDCGRVAEAAGVKTLVLTHRVPTDDPTVTDQMWVDAARSHFRGTVIVATDLMEV